MEGDGQVREVTYPRKLAIMAKYGENAHQRNDDAASMKFADRHWL